MKSKLVIAALILSGWIMNTAANTDQEKYKIRILFNIKKSFCAIRTNGILGMDNRDSAYAGRGAGISSTNAMLFLENGENDISLEIGALGWFSRESLTNTERNKFDTQSGCKIEMIKSKENEQQVLSIISVGINNSGIPELIKNHELESNQGITFSKVVAEEVKNGHIDPKYFWRNYFPQGMELYKFTHKLILTDIPQWKWIDASPFMGTDEQVEALRQSYLEIAEAIKNHDRHALKSLHKISLSAWAATTGNTEDSILESQYSKEEIEKGNAIINPIIWNDYSVRVMNKGRIVQFYNKSEITYSPLSFYITEANGKKNLYSYSPMFSLIDGKFVVVI